jgi:hypothetical protein
LPEQDVIQQSMIFVLAVREHRKTSLIVLLGSDQADDGRLFVRLQQKTDWKRARAAGENSVCWMVSNVWSLVARRPARRAATYSEKDRT